MKTELSVQGMTCRHCVKHVTEALQKVPGVARAEVALEGRATIDHDERAGLPLLLAAVQEAGYSVDRGAL